MARSQEATVAVRKMFNIGVILSAIALTVIGVTLFSIYEATQLVPDFYHEAVTRDPHEQQEPRDQFVAQATLLASDLHRTGRWQSLFTEEQINAWMALELAAHYPELLPKELHDPRVLIRDKEITAACRFENNEMAAVLSLTMDAYLQNTHTLALRIRRARAGALPVPLGQILDTFSQVARQLDLRLEWRKIQGDPVALISFASGGHSPSDEFRLQAIELRNGELFLSGTIGETSKVASPEESSPATEAAESTAENREASESSQSALGSAPKETRQK